MTLKEKIQADLIEAIKAKDLLKVSTLRLMKNEIQKYEVSGKDMVATDDVILGIFKKEVKKRVDAAEQFRAGKREELAKKEEEEIKIIKTYLPEEMGEEEIKKALKEIMSEQNLSNKEDMGKLMGMAMGKLKGKADGGLINKIAKELLKN